MMNRQELITKIYKNLIDLTSYSKIRVLVKILFQNGASKIIFLLVFGLIFFNQIYTRSQVFMPTEYKLVKKIFNKISLNNNFGNNFSVSSVRSSEGREEQRRKEKERNPKKDR